MIDAGGHRERLKRARVALEGLSVGDAFGECYFVEPDVDGLIARHQLAEPPWPFTDDTQMALSVFDTLRQHGEIRQDHLAAGFVCRYDGRRGYGPSMHGLLASVRGGTHWRAAAPAQFGGRGSYGNGAAMRGAPLGAYFADDLDAVIEQAERPAVVTHSHPEAAAGAIAVALATAWAVQLRHSGEFCGSRELLDRVRASVPESEVAERIRHARNLVPGSSVRLAISALGNGTGISAQDTVPFSLWCAAQHLDDFEAALWLTVSGLGDRDTTCAIVGGIVAAYTGVEGIPPGWRAAREPLPVWTQRGRPE